MAAKCDSIEATNYECNERKVGFSKKNKATNYECNERKFGFSNVLWVIKNGCITPPVKDVLRNKIFRSPEFYVRGLHLTKWVMSLERSFEDETHLVSFCLRMLECPSEFGKARADCILEYTGHAGEEFQIEFIETFIKNERIEYRRDITHAGITPTEHHHIHEFKLKLGILVNFEDATHSFPFCENFAIMRLSEDLYQLYEDGVVADLKLAFDSDRTLPVHKAILISRVTKQAFREEIFESNNVIHLGEKVPEDVEQVIRFLYTGNLRYVVDPAPSIAVFKFAVELCVKPILGYYNPDEITLTSDTDVEEFSVTWTIEKFLSRDDDFLLSPVMTNKMMDTKWRMKVYPKGYRNRGHLDIFLFFEITGTKDICVELFLQDGPGGKISYRRHERITAEGTLLKTNEFIKLDIIENYYMRNDSLTIGFRLRMSTGHDSSSVGESKTGYKHLPEQKNYNRLSHDIFTLYRISYFSDLHRSLDYHNIILDAHECILQARCTRLFSALNRNEVGRLNAMNNVVISEMLNFVYSGKLTEGIILQNIFGLYRAADGFNFQNLKDAVIERLRNLLYRDNALSIHIFAALEGIYDLEQHARLFY